MLLPSRGAPTQAMTGCGSILWMAPEIVNGELFNEKIDVYSCRRLPD